MNGMNSGGGGGRGYGRRRNRNNRQNHHRESGSRQRQERPQTSESPPSEPRVVLLRPSTVTSVTISTTSVTVPTVVTSIAQPTRAASPRIEPRNNSSPNITSTHSRVTSSPVQLYQVKPYVPEDESKKELRVPNEPMKLIDFESWTFQDHPSIEYMSNDKQSSTGFKVISVVGSQSSGKSRLMNLIAGKNVFKTHDSHRRKESRRDSSNDDSSIDLFDSVTKGVDFMVTGERLFLLDSQALLSPSILDELIVSSNISISSNDYVSNEADLLFVSSLQLVTFLMSVSDCLIITSDYFVDIDLLKLLAMSLKLLSSMGASTSAANIVWYLSRKVSQTEVHSITSSLENCFGRGSVVVINADEDELVRTALTTSTETRRGRSTDSFHQSQTMTSSTVVSERMWFVTSQRFWESSIKKSAIFNDYMRFGNIDG